MSSEVETKADDLRLRGNDAFGTKDFERAVPLYEQSVACHPTAKAYANLAAALCKLGRTQEALAAAERATVLDPKWAKGWWRRGVVAELLKFFSEAHKYFEIAVVLDPKEKTFQTALRRVAKRMNIPVETKRVDGKLVLEATTSPLVLPSDFVLPTVRAYLRAQNAILGDRPDPVQVAATYDQIEAKYVEKQRRFPTSEQRLFHGLNKWVLGMRGALGALCLHFSEEARAEYQNLVMYGTSHELAQSVKHLLGGLPHESHIENLVDGLCRAGSRYIRLEFFGPHVLVPPPRFLSQFLAYQSLGILWSTDMLLSALLEQHRFPPALKSCKAILLASTALYDNLHLPYPHNITDVDQDPSPKEIVDYIQDLLENQGKTWDDGVCQYVSLQYRGAILYAFLARMLFVQIAEAYKWEKWANDFIQLADEKFNVSQEKSYAEKGTAFMPSVRVGALMLELESLEILRAGAVNGPYSMEMSLDLCGEVSEMAHNADEESNEDYTDYIAAQRMVAYCRTPLAVAHSMIAAELNIIRSAFNVQDFKQIAAHHGFIDSIEDDCDPFALITEHCRIAAENELPDANEAAYYWWAYGANMVQVAATNNGSNDDGNDDNGTHVCSRTLGHLRKAIRMAEAAERARDIGLFDENKLQDGSFETIAKQTAMYFQDKPDSFFLPQVRLIKDSLIISDDRNHDIVISSNLTQCFVREQELHQDNTKWRKMLDTSELEKAHGFLPEFGVPSLETLCIRSLHASNCPYANGETDGAVIHYKAMMAAWNSEEQKE